MGLILDCSEQRPQIKYEICHEITNEQHYFKETSNNKLSSISNRTNNNNNENENNKSKRYLKLYNSKIKNEEENFNEKKLFNKKQNEFHSIIDSFQKNIISEDDFKKNKNNFFRNSNREISSILNLGSNNYLDDSSINIEFTNEKFNQLKQKNKKISFNKTPQIKKNLLRNNSLSKLSTATNRKNRKKISILENFNDKKNDINKDLIIQKMIFVENKIKTKNKNNNSKNIIIKPTNNRTPSPRISNNNYKKNKDNLSKLIFNNNENNNNKKKLKKSSSFSERKNKFYNNKLNNNYNDIFQNKNNNNQNENSFINIPIKYKYSKVNKNLIYNDENKNKYIKLSYMILNSINTDYIIYDGLIYKVQRTKINGFKLIEKYFQLTKNQFKYFNSIYSSQVYNNLPLVQFDIRNIINIEITDKDYLLNFINIENSSHFVFTIILKDNEYFIFSTENDEIGNNIITIINLLIKYYSFFKSNNTNI